MVNLPYVVSGKITDSDGSNPSGAPIVVRNDSTVETIETTTNGSGDYSVDLANFSSGYTIGDQVTVIARFGLEDGTGSFITQSDEASHTVNITTSEVLDSTDVTYCTISEVLRELDDKTTSDISSRRVRDAILRSEAEIDSVTETSFKSNTVTDEFYDTSDENMFLSPQARIGGGVNVTLQRADSRFGGGIDSIKLKRDRLLTVTSLSKNIAGQGEADSFTALSEQSGSGGDFIVDYDRGIITFISNGPSYGRKRAFKISYTWGMDRSSTDRETVMKKELVRQLCILLSVRQVLMSKASSSQFSSIDSISLESISISKGVGQSVTYLQNLQTRINELWEALGVFNAGVGVI